VVYEVLDPFGDVSARPLVAGIAHDVQVPQLAAPQHTDSTQWPLRQSLPTVQAWPSRPGAPELELEELEDELDADVALEAAAELDADTVLAAELCGPLKPEVEVALVVAPPVGHVSNSPQSDDAW
jgi:hypothetical protein